MDRFGLNAASLAARASARALLALLLLAPWGAI